MTTMRRVWMGTVLGILAAWLAFPAMLSFYWRPGDKLDLVPMLGFVVGILPFLTILAGPGAFLLSLLHACQMESWAPRARTVRQIRKVGVLLGLPLGVANLILPFVLFTMFKNGDLSVTAEMLQWLLPALAGGAGLGWGVTIGLKPDPVRPARVVRRTFRPRLRRNGPPFFDNRPARMIRRAS